MLRETADALVGDEDAALIVNDTALPKQGKHSVGVKRQHCVVLGKQANCQVLVSLTLAQKEMPVPITLGLYLPKDWEQDKARRAQAEVPESISFETKGDIPLAQIDIASADGVRFGTTLADAGYGSSADFRAGLTQRGLRDHRAGDVSCGPGGSADCRELLFRFVAAGIGSLTSGWLRDLTGGYVMPFLVAAGLGVIGLLRLRKRLRYVRSRSIVPAKWIGARPSADALRRGGAAVRQELHGRTA